MSIPTHNVSLVWCNAVKAALDFDLILSYPFTRFSPPMTNLVLV